MCHLGLSTKHSLMVLILRCYDLGNRRTGGSVTSLTRTSYIKKHTVLLPPWRADKQCKWEGFNYSGKFLEEVMFAKKRSPCSLKQIFCCQNSNSFYFYSFVNSNELSFQLSFRCYILEIRTFNEAETPENTFSVTQTNESSGGSRSCFQIESRQREGLTVQETSNYFIYRLCFAAMM